MEGFDVPVVLFIFKRKDTLALIMERISQVKPRKLYILADGPRNAEEVTAVTEARKELENLITWDCTVIKNYAESNRGVFENIGMGARWVLEREPYAIFLEDDNLPEFTFFAFCKELLEKYKHDTRVLWICGTNYLQKYEPVDGASYVFTKHLMPCGWASWSEKFLEFYDGDLSLLDDDQFKYRIRTQYADKRLYRQQLMLAEMEKSRMRMNLKPISWDFHMEFSIRANSLYGISPKYNQIENIGVDTYATHGGSTFKNEMVERFCTIKGYQLDFPLVHPKAVIPDPEYEKQVGKIILHPLRYRVKSRIARIIRMLLGLPPGGNIRQEIQSRLSRKQ